MSGATLDGLTPDQFIDVCEKAANRTAKAQMARHPDMRGKRPLNTAETASLNVGISCGINAAFAELARRGLIVERP